MKQCLQCLRNFKVDEQDKAFYVKMDVPEPTLCPPCRQQRRLAFRNEINFFQRKCDKTGKQILTMYAPESPYLVYDHEQWWKDDWDAASFGRPFDFTRPFFEQFEELRRRVPRMSLNAINNENSYYTNYALSNKNSYLVTTADFNEDCYYGRFSDRNFRCVDFDFTYDSRFCYQTIDVHRSQNCFFSQKLDGCSDNYFCYDMRNCHNCLFSVNQRNQSYLVYNKKVSPEEFARMKEELKLSSWSGMKNAFSKALAFWQSQPHKYLENINCEDCIGDYLKNSKNARFCFDSYNLHDVAYCSIVFGIKDCYDWDFVGDESERCYEMVSSAGQNMFCRFCMNVWQGNTNLSYCDLCLFSNDLFGCVGLRRKQYCILNKQYTKEEYEQLVLRIIEHMKKTGEWGEFFPISMSPFAYNDSVACEYYPLSKEETEAKNLVWRISEPRASTTQSYSMPDDIKDVRDDILSSTLACETCGKGIKIIQQELAYYREIKLPTPRSCWVCRHWQRRALKNPRIVHRKTCSNCQANILTTYAEDRPEPVYCETCYLHFVS